MPFAICPRYDITSPVDVENELLLILSNNYKNEILTLSITIPYCVDTFTFLHYDIRYTMRLNPPNPQHHDTLLCGRLLVVHLRCCSGSALTAFATFCW